MPSSKSIPLGEISVTYVEAILETLATQGYPRRLITQKYNLPDSFLNTPGARISIPKFMRIGHEALSLCQTPHFGLLMGKTMKVGHIGIAGFAAMSASTVAKALQTLIEFETLSSRNSRGRSRFYIENKRPICQFYSISPYNSFNYFVVDSTLCSWLSFARWLSDYPDIVHHVEVEYASPDCTVAYEELFNCPVYFGAQRNALVLKTSTINRKSLYANETSYKALRQICDAEKIELEKGKNLSDRVTELITERLSGSSPSIHDIAKQMGMAGWTLRRRLAKTGKPFHVILDETRQALALSYARDTEHNFTEIAFLLGFSSPAAFQRAFKRWTAMSPGQYRARSARSS